MWFWWTILYQLRVKSSGQIIPSAITDAGDFLEEDQLRPEGNNSP